MPPPSAVRRVTAALARTDSHPAALRAAHSVRRLLPDTTMPVLPERRPSDRVARLIAAARPTHDSATRELGLTAVALWQAVRRRGTAGAPVPATILFTDLVGFSSWALAVGDDQVLRLLREVNSVTETAIERHGGRVVKSLGDGIMAGFAHPEDAILSAHEAIDAVTAITIDGYRPQLRAGVHTGAPRAVGEDFLGVDVNIAARVAAAAGPGELLASDATLGDIDTTRYATRRRRRFKAKGVPKALTVHAIVPRYDD